MSASALAVSLPGKPCNRPCRDFVRDLHVKFGQPPSEQTTKMLAESVLGASVLHRSSSSLAEKHSEEAMGAASAKVGRTPLEHRPVSKREAATMMANALRAAFGKRAVPIKHIQDIALVDRKTAESWWHGRSVPGFHHALTLMREVPELAGEVRRLTAMHADMDPEFERAFADLQQMYQRMRARP